MCWVCVPADDDDDDDDMDGEAEFYDSEEAVLSGPGAEQRAARLNHFDQLLQMPSAQQFSEVRNWCLGMDLTHRRRG